MGFGAIIGAVGSLAAAGIGAASKGGLFGGGGGPDMGQYASRLNEAANQYILPFTDPSKWELNIPAMAATGIGFGLTNAPAINQANMGQLQDLLTRAMPGWQGMFNQMQTNTNALLAGAVPQDVQDQIRRNAAFTSLMGGSAGAGTGATGTITARDLGLTSLQLQQTGQQQGTNLLNFARNYLMPQPVNPMSLLPLSDLISGTEWSKSAVFQANEAAYTAKANAAAAGIGAPSQGLAGTLGGITGGLQSLFGQGPSGQSPIQSLLGMFGGGGGGGGTTTVGGNIYPTGASGLLNTSADPNPDYAFF
jgi:hypothetical protein